MIILLTSDIKILQTYIRLHNTPDIRHCNTVDIGLHNTADIWHCKTADIWHYNTADIRHYYTADIWHYNTADIRHHNTADIKLYNIADIIYFMIQKYKDFIILQTSDFRHETTDCRRHHSLVMSSLVKSLHPGWIFELIRAKEIFQIHWTIRNFHTSLDIPQLSLSLLIYFFSSSFFRSISLLFCLYLYPVLKHLSIRL